MSLVRRFDGKKFNLIAANRSSTKPFSRKKDAQDKAKFYKRQEVFDKVRVVKVKKGYLLYARSESRRRRRR